MLKAILQDEKQRSELTQCLVVLEKKESGLESELVR